MPETEEKKTEEKPTEIPNQTASDTKQTQDAAEKAEGSVVPEFNYKIEETNLKPFYENNVLKMSFAPGKGLVNSEHVDIITNYGWTGEPIVKPRNGGNTNPAVPFLLAKERRQRVNSSIMNYVNLIYSASNAASAADSSLAAARIANRGASAAVTLATTAGMTAANMVGAAFNKAKEWIITASSGKTTIMAGDPDLKNFLHPYKYLYLTETTGKSFVFPMLNQGEGYLSLTGAWNSEPQNSGLISNFITGAVEDFATNVAMTGNDAVALSQAIMMNSTSIEQAYIEKAKSYNFPEEGQTVKCNFVLYNTGERGIWEKHYRFLYLFALRNLPYKITPYSYIPPLLYDLIMEGYKRLPLCYVSNFQVLQHGIVRNMVAKTIFGKDPKTRKAVAVPEAWGVSIEFKSLLSPSANLMLQESSSGSEIQIETRLENYDIGNPDWYAEGGGLDNATATNPNIRLS